MGGASARLMPLPTRRGERPAARQLDSCLLRTSKRGRNGLPGLGQHGLLRSRAVGTQSSCLQYGCCLCRDFLWIFFKVVLERADR